MKIVLLNPRESFDESALDVLKSVHEIISYQGAEAENLDMIISLHADADILIVTYVALNCDILIQFRQLKAIFATTTAVEYIDTQYAKANNIQVFNNPAYTESAVAEHLLSLILTVARRIPLLNTQTQAGDFKQFQQIGFELSGKTLGIMGMGSIGQRLAELVQGFKMRIQYYNRSEKTGGYSKVDLETLLSTSDVIAITLPLTPETEHLINDARIKSMKNNSIIVSTSPDEIFDMDALVHAIENNKFFGVGLDLHNPQQSLYHKDNVVVTPTKAWLTQECMQRRTKAWINSLMTFLKSQEPSGEPSSQAAMSSGQAPLSAEPAKTPPVPGSLVSELGTFAQSARRVEPSAKNAPSEFDLDLKGVK